METEIQKITAEQIRPGCFRRAGELLRAGQTVAIPTETVYGLAAWIGSEEGIRRIYEAKGRPSDNPLIVHIYPGCPLGEIAAQVPELARPLMEAYWPGPMTLVMPKAPAISPRITGGLDTVAVRMPSHPVARALLTELKMPLVAPSANTSGRPSPTRAEHVFEDLKGRIPLILDGGPCGVGLESTVIDVTGEKPVILRPGAITKEMIEAVLGETEVDPAVTAGGMKDPKAVPRAPGMKYRHYAPQGKLTLLEGSSAWWGKMLEERPEPEKAWGLLLTRQLQEDLQENRLVPPDVRIICLGDRDKPEELAAGLFGALREIDRAGIELAYGEALSRAGLGEAVMNRFLKAAGGELRREEEKA